MPVRQKILYIITKSVWGGAQRYVFDLATRLPADRFDIAVACGGNGPFAQKLQERGIRTIPVAELERDVGFGKEIRAFWSLFRICRREQPDIIHLSSSKAGGIGAAAARLSSCFAHHSPLVVFTVHGWPFNEDRPWWQRIAIFLASWCSVLLHDRVIIITTADYRTARKFIPERKLALIFHGIASIPFLPRSDARAFFSERMHANLAADALLVGANAELTRNKGLGYLIAAAAEMKSKIHNLEFRILVIGEGEERQRLQEKIHRLGLEDTIFLIGFVPDARRYLRALDLFVLPSVKEGLPYALMEAAAAGLPIAATRVGGIPDIIHHGETGLVVAPKDPAALAEAMSRLLNERMFATRLGSHARDKAFKSFRIDAMIANTISLYGADI